MHSHPGPSLRVPTLFHVGCASVCPKATIAVIQRLPSVPNVPQLCGAVCALIAGKLEPIENVSDSADFPFSNSTTENVISSLYLIGPTVGQYAALRPLGLHCTADLESRQKHLPALLRMLAWARACAYCCRSAVCCTASGRSQSAGMSRAKLNPHGPAAAAASPAAAAAAAAAAPFG